jgi:hypothetical protein
MVTLDGKIPPFRITRNELLELVTQIERKIETESDRIRYFDVALGNFSQTCKDIDELRDFLKDIYLPKVVKEGSLYIFGEKISIGFFFGESRASYRIIDAENTSQARSFEDLISTLFRKHRASIIFDQNTMLLMFSPIVLALFLTVYPIAHSVFVGSTLQYRGVYLFGAICTVVFLSYLIWSSYTSDTPSFSFFHSIIWIEEPKTNVTWALISSILVGVLISFIFQLIS